MQSKNWNFINIFSAHSLFSVNNMNNHSITLLKYYETGFGWVQAKHIIAEW